MSTITLPNIRVSSDLTVKVRLKDGGVAVDWSTLSRLKAFIYSDDQQAIAGRCAVSIDGDDHTLLVCQYSANKSQYLGVNRIIVSASYMSETKTYDKPALNFVRWTDDQEGEQITISDPDVEVEIEVEDISSSILQEAVDAAFSAAERAEDAAEAAEHMVDIHTGPEGKSAYEVAVDEGYTGTEEEWLASLKGDTGETPNITIGTVTTVEPGTPAAATMTGTPEAPVLNLTIPKGAVGDTPNFTVGEVTTGQPGTPVVVTITGTAAAPVLNITIPQGMQGNTGSSVDYPYELVNNLTTNDATKGLSAAQGKVLKDEITQLDLKVTPLIDVYTRNETLDTTSYPLRDFSIKTDGTYGTGATYKHCLVEIIPGDLVKITAPSGTFTRFCFVKSTTAPEGGGAIDLCTGQSCVELSAGTSQTFIAPIDAVAFLFYRGQSPYPSTPDGIVITSAVKPIDNLESNDGDAPLSANQGRILDEKIDNTALEVNELGDAMDNLTQDVDATVYENVGQESYYQQYGTSFGYKGVATYTPELANESKVNRIVFPPYRVRYDTTDDVSYYIAYGDFSSNIVPNSLTQIAEGVIRNVTKTLVYGYTLALDNPVTIPAGKRVFIFLYCNTNDTYILGGGSSSTTLNPYSSDDAVVLLYNTDSNTPFSQTWNKASGNTTARYRACNPLLKLFIEAVIPSIVEEQIETEVPGKVNEIIADKEKVNIYLPNQFYAVVGDTLQLFFQGIVGVVNIAEYDIYAECSKGKTYPRYFSYTPSIEDVGTTTLTIYVKDRNNNILGQASCDLVTIDAPTSPVSAKSIFTFGDSLTSGGEWPGEAKRRLVGNSTYDGITGNSISNLSFYGYMTKVIHEQSVNYFGVGGWTWANYLSKGTGGAFRFYVSGVSSLSIGATYTNNGHTYTIQEINVTGDTGNIRCTTSANTNTPTASGTLTKSTGDGDATISFTTYETENQNPLWDDVNNKMSFIPYVSDCGASTIDAVFVLLSWNGQESWKEYSVDDATGHIANAKTFARTLHDEYPGAKLFIMGLQMPSETGGLGYNYGASGGYIDGYGLKQCALNYNKALQDLCNDAEFSPYCEFVAIAPQFDSHYNMPYYNTKVNIRSSVTERLGSNGVHPSNSGYYQIADAVYRAIVANFCQSE